MIMRNDYKNLTLRELIQEAKRDDVWALGELIKREQKNVYATLYYLNVSEDEILDLVQEILLKIAKNIKQLKKETTFKSWLNQIIVRQFYDHLRKKKRSCHKVSLTDDKIGRFCREEIPDNTCLPYQKVLGGELGFVIKNSIEKLSDPFKMAIIMREVQGLSYEQIADITKTNVGTVKSRIARARGKLREYIRPYMC